MSEPSHPFTIVCDEPPTTITTGATTTTNHHLTTDFPSPPIASRQLSVSVAADIPLVIRSHRSSVTSTSGSYSNMSDDGGMFKTMQSAGVLDSDGMIHADIQTADNLITQMPMTPHQTRTYQKTTTDFFDNRRLVTHAEWYHIMAWAGTCILSATLFSWNTAMSTGVGPLLLGTALNGVAFMVLSWSLAEMASSLPFSGGSYGFVRATIGLRTGMFVGLAESLEYVLTTAVNCVQTTTLLSIIFATDVRWCPLWDLAIYTLSLAAYIRGGKLFWNVIAVGFVLTVVPIVLYILSTLQYLGDFAVNSTAQYPVWNGTGQSFLATMPVCVWWYVGIEAMPLASEETRDSKTNVPKGTVWGMVMVICLNIAVLFTCVATPNADLAGTPFPLVSGFTRMVGLADGSANQRWVYLLLVPPMAMACYSFIFAYSRQMFAMSRSGLLPAWISLTNSRGVPWVSTILGSAIGYLLCLVGRLAFQSDQFESYSTVLYNMMLIVAVINYLLLLVAYCILKQKYSMLARKYNSPVGIPGAVVALIIFLIDLIGLCGYSVHIEYSIGGTMIWFVAGMMYYILVSSKKLILSPEEQFTMFMLYSVKFIQTKERRLNARKYSQAATSKVADRSATAHTKRLSVDDQQRHRTSLIVATHKTTSPGSAGTTMIAG